ncbi:MAG: methyltransferase domain-containing protein [Pseudolysinimonas sp.]
MSITDHETAKARRVWQKAAPTYDDKMAAFERAFLGGGREWIASRARGRVLEIAIGTGLDLPHYPPDVTITGVDLSPAMMRGARARAADLGREVQFVVGDAQHLPFGDAGFDTVVCALGLCSFSDPAGAIAEMKRVLVPGGLLLLLDHIRSSWPPVLAAQWLVERITVPLAGERFTRRQLPLVTAAGFELVETERSKAGTIELVHARKAPAI